MPPGWTLLLAINDACTTIGMKLSDPSDAFLSASATSDGELTRVGKLDVENVGGPLVRPTSESAGNTRYISTTTFDMLLVDVPDGISPVKAAPLINVC